MFSLNPGATFRRLMTFYENGRSGPKLDLTGVVFEVRNLDYAPWVIQVLDLNRVEGMMYLYIPDTLTMLGKEFTQYPFQIRMLYPSADWQYLPQLVISTGPAYLAEDPSDPEVLAAFSHSLPIPVAPYYSGLDKMGLADNLEGSTRLREPAE